MIEQNEAGAAESGVDGDDAHRRQRDRVGPDRRTQREDAGRLRLIARQDASGKATALQRQALEDIDAIIKQLRQQRQSSQQRSGGPQPSVRSDVRPQPGQQQGSQPGSQTARQPARDSDSSTRHVRENELRFILDFTIELPS